MLQVTGGFMVEYFNFNLKDRRILIGTTEDEAIQKCLDYISKLGDTDGTDD